MKRIRSFTSNLIQEIRKRKQFYIESQNSVLKTDALKYMTSWRGFNQLTYDVITFEFELIELHLYNFSLFVYHCKFFSFTLSYGIMGCNAFCFSCRLLFGICHIKCVICVWPSARCLDCI